MYGAVRCTLRSIRSRILRLVARDGLDRLGRSCFHRLEIEGHFPQGIALNQDLLADVHTPAECNSRSSPVPLEVRREPLGAWVIALAGRGTARRYGWDRVTRTGSLVDRPQAMQASPIVLPA